MAGAIEEYLDNHPFRIWDQNSWTERDSTINTRFHQSDIIYTPLVGYGMTMPAGVGRTQYWHVGAETVRSHVNHNDIGWYQRMMDSISNVSGPIAKSMAEKLLLITGKAQAWVIAWQAGRNPVQPYRLSEEAPYQETGGDAIVGSASITL